MKNCLFILTMAFSSSVSCQITRNMILSIDDKIVKNCNLDISILAELENGKLDTIEAKYCPGELVCYNIDSAGIEAKKYSKFTLLISIIGSSDQRFMGTVSHSKQYLIPFYTHWYKTAYMVYSIYDMTLKKNIFKYVNSKRKKYLFELTTPNYSLQLLRKG